MVREGGGEEGGEGSNIRDQGKCRWRRRDRKRRRKGGRWTSRKRTSRMRKGRRWRGRSKGGRRWRKNYNVQKPRMINPIFEIQ